MTLTKFSLILLTMISTASPIVAQSPSKITSSSVTFKIKNMGLTVDGTFGGLIATIKFDPSHYAQSTMEATIDVNTIQTGIKMRDKDLKKPEFFDVAKYPIISLKSTSFFKVTDGSYKGTFKLTIKGITNDIMIPFTCIEAGKSMALKSTFELNRRDFSIGGSSLTMSDTVAISVVINTLKP